MTTKHGNGTDPVVLCVDDEPQVLAALERELRGCACRVLTASNGTEAVQILEAHQVAVLFCDEAMPGMRGVEVLAHARVHSPHTVRVLLSAHCAEVPVVVSAVEQAAAARLLPKPWNGETIRQIVSAALKQMDRTHVVVAGRDGAASAN